MRLNKKIKNIESKWFEKNISNYQEVYAPIKLARNLNLKHDDKIAVKIKTNNSVYIFPARIRYRIKKDGNCFRFQVPVDIQGYLSGRIQIKIIKLYKPSQINLKEDEIDLADFSNVAEWIDNKSLVLWDNMKHPLIVSRIVNALDFAKYLGLYYADGGKTSHYSCCCSTKDMSKLVLNYYKKIIRNPRYTIFIVYKKLSKELDQEIIERIVDHWSKLVDISPSDVKLNGYKKTSQHSTKYGILRIDDSRLLTLDIHKWLTKEVLKLGNKNTKILEEFLKGGLLGDGLVSTRRKEAFQYIAISSNSKEYCVWEYICKKLGLDYNIKMDNKADAVYVRFRDYYNSVQLYKNGVFAEYQKRRKKLLKGLKNSVETYIAQQLLRSNFNPIPIKGKFGSVTPSFFYVNKGGDLIKNNLISLENNNVTITNRGKQFIKDLIDLKILEVG
ncbi:hypothetical protein JYT91_01200 [archaeon AH-315-M20]|nr:hypothetical protein [archaeon AH-315-M20]